MTASERIREARKNGAQQQRVEAFAWKFIEASDEAEPTDEALSRVFANCVRPAKPELYPAIRASVVAARKYENEVPPPATSSERRARYSALVREIYAAMTARNPHSIPHVRLCAAKGQAWKRLERQGW